MFIILQQFYSMQRIEYAEICKTIKKKAREDIRKYNHEKRSRHQRALRKSEVADTRPRETDHTLGQACKKNP